MALEYFPWYNSYFKKCEKLTDQELGRLVRALSTYSITGERQELAGRESIAFDFIADDIDRAKEAYAEKCAKSKKSIESRYERTRTNTDEYERTRTNTNEYESYQTKSKTKTKSKDKSNISSPNGERDNTAATPQGTRASKKFVPPTVDEVREYCVANKLNVNAEDFVAYFTEMHWHDVNGNPVKLWKGKVRTWAKFNHEKPVRGAKSPVPDPAQNRVGSAKQAVESMAWMDEFMAKEGIGIDRSGER